MPERWVSIGRLADEVGLSQNWLRALADNGQIPCTRTSGGHRRFDVDAVRVALTRRRDRRSGAVQLTPDPVEPARTPDWNGSFALQRLAEDEVWAEVRQELGLGSTSNAERIFAYAFTEMLNNAIDHSRGAEVRVDVWADAERLAARLHDDGVGVFAHLREARGLADEMDAVAELSKGKVTTMPERHTGEGIFFTSKSVDVFQLSAGRLRWTVDNLRGDVALGQVGRTVGTTVFLQIDPATSRVLREVFAAFTDGGRFTRTRPSVKLLSLGTTFVSRSEARRILEGLDAFTEIEMDFQGVSDVGQGFVDEVFRVWPDQHPDSRVVPVNMNEAVEFMVRRGLPH